MTVRVYRLTAANLATNTGQATTTIIAKGKIVQVQWSGGIVGGAAAGVTAYEVALNNTSNGNATTATGAPSENIVSRAIMVHPITSLGQCNFAHQVNRPVVPGNTICFNLIATGTSGTTAMVGCDVYVEEA